MKNTTKILSNVILAGLATSLISACTGSCGSSTPSTTPVQATQIPTPPGTQVDRSAVYVNGSTVYLPAGASYQPVNVQGANAAAFLTALTTGNPEIQSNAGPAVALLVVTNGNTTYALFADGSVGTQSIKAITTATAESANTTDTVTNTLAVPQLTGFTESGILFGTNTHLKLAGYTGVTTTATSGAISNCASAAGNFSTINVATVGSSTYVGAGTSNGYFCVYTTGASSPWTNLTGSATGHNYNTGSAITTTSFTAINSNLFGYWLNANGQIWEVVATSGASGITPKQFSQVNGSGTQGNINVGGGGTIAYTGGPTASAGNIASIYSDNNNTLYVGTSNGYIYKISNGATNWTNASIGSGNVTLTATNTGTGAVATVTGATFQVQ